MFTFTTAISIFVLIMLHSEAPLPTTDQTILLAIFENPNASARTLQKKTGISPRILRTHLDDLDTRGLVHQEKPKGVKDTHYPAYPSTLTKKGIDYICDKRLFNDLWREAMAPLKILRNLVARLAHDPKWMEQVHTDRVLRDEFEGKKFEEDAKKDKDSEAITVYDPEGYPHKLGKSAQELIERVNERSKDDPLRESLKAIYDIFLQVNLVERIKGGWAMTILEDGSVLLRQNALIERTQRRELDLSFSDTEGKHITT